jgi:hypothetical protein
MATAARSSEGLRSNVLNPDLNWTKTLLAQSGAVRADLVVAGIISPRRWAWFRTPASVPTRSSR